MHLPSWCSTLLFPASTSPPLLACGQNSKSIFFQLNYHSGQFSELMMNPGKRNLKDSFSFGDAWKSFGVGYNRTLSVRRLQRSRWRWRFTLSVTLHNTDAWVHETRVGEAIEQSILSEWSNKTFEEHLEDRARFAVQEWSSAILFWIRVLWDGLGGWDSLAIPLEGLAEEVTIPFSLPI